MNKVILRGHLGQDPKPHQTASGVVISNFSIATSDGWGEKKRTNWHDIVVFKKQAEACNQYLKKGSHVLVDGMLQKREYNDRNGNKRYSVEVVAQSVEFLDPKDGNSGGGSSSRNQSNDSHGDDYLTDDDIPF